MNSLSWLIFYELCEAFLQFPPKVLVFFCCCPEFEAPFVIWLLFFSVVWLLVNNQQLNQVINNLAGCYRVVISLVMQGPLRVPRLFEITDGVDSEYSQSEKIFPFLKEKTKREDGKRLWIHPRNYDEIIAVRHTEISIFNWDLPNLVVASFDWICIGFGSWTHHRKILLLALQKFCVDFFIFFIYSLSRTHKSRSLNCFLMIHIHMFTVYRTVNTPSTSWHHTREFYGSREYRATPSGDNRNL